MKCSIGKPKRKKLTTLEPVSPCLVRKILHTLDYAEQVRISPFTSG